MINENLMKFQWFVMYIWVCYNNNKKEVMP
jgi:hypothetical protein